MKKLAAILIAPAICLCLCACAPAQSVGGAQPVEVDSMYIYINGNRLEAELEDNSSVEALVALLNEGDITYTADDYGGFEKVGYIGHTLPRNDEYITVSAGDVILYQGNNICLYYGSNSWNFTRLGRINGCSVQQLRTLLGAGQGAVQVTLSLA